MKKILRKIDKYTSIAILSIIVGAFFFAKMFDMMTQFWLFFCVLFIPFLLLGFLWSGFIWIGIVTFILFCLVKTWLTFNINDVPSE